MSPSCLLRVCGSEWPGSLAPLFRASFIGVQGERLDVPNFGRIRRLEGPRFMKCSWSDDRGECLRPACFVYVSPDGRLVWPRCSGHRPTAFPAVAPLRRPWTRLSLDEWEVWRVQNS